MNFVKPSKQNLVYRKVSSGDQDPSLKELFLKAQKSFDLEVPRTKRAYHRHLHEKLLSNYRTKPRDFWRQIGLGIHQEQKKGLPNKLKDLNGEITQTLCIYGNPVFIHSSKDQIYSKKTLLLPKKSLFDLGLFPRHVLSHDCHMMPLHLPVLLSFSWRSWKCVYISCVMFSFKDMSL